MIQRIQTLWFLVGGICIALIPVLASIGLSSVYPQLPAYVPQILVGLIVLICSMTLFAIFRFKDRKGQILLTHLLVLDVILLALLRFGFLFATGGQSAVFGTADAQLNATAFGLMLLAIFCFLLARKGIIADQKLLKSVDRLRD